MVDPISSNGSTSQSAQGKKQLDAQYSDFLKLLTTQLQNQDPTNPTDTDQMVQNLAVLSQVEQQLKTNDNLMALINLFNATQYNSMYGLLGKQVEAAGNAGSLEDGKALFSYYLGQEAAVVDFTIKNDLGEVVYTGSGTTDKGRNEIVWNGKNNAGEKLSDGVYTIEVSAKDGGNNAVTAQTYTTGIVDSIDSINGNIYASCGQLSLLIKDIISVMQI